jgi:hypothetical protein
MLWDHSQYPDTNIKQVSSHRYTCPTLVFTIVGDSSLILLRTSGSKFSKISKIKESLVSVFFEEIQNLGTADCSSGLFWDFQN